MLGRLKVVDWLLQQAIAKWLITKYERGFSGYSYRFRVGLNTHHEELQAQEYLNDGYEWVIELDLENFFDKVNHDRQASRLVK